MTPQVAFHVVNGAPSMLSMPLTRNTRFSNPRFHVACGAPSVPFTRNTGVSNPYSRLACGAPSVPLTSKHGILQLPLPSRLWCSFSASHDKQALDSQQRHSCSTHLFKQRRIFMTAHIALLPDPDIHPLSFASSSLTPSSKRWKFGFSISFFAGDASALLLRLAGFSAAFSSVNVLTSSWSSSTRHCIA